MGREIKRVEAGFDWPLDQTWKGYLNPYQPVPCPQCKNGYGSDGLTAEARAVADSFYDSGYNGSYPSPHRWCDKITQEEVNLLVDEYRLYDFACRTRVLDDDGNFLRWERSLNEDGTPYYPTAEEVNAWERGRGLGHDAINRWILIEYRWKEQGVTDTKCSMCDGEACLFATEGLRRQSENFHEGDPSIGAVWTEPPEGEWWQVWETVGEGSPVTPAFATPEELIEYLVANGDVWSQNRRARHGYNEDPPPSRKAATRFVLASGWVPSGSGPKGGPLTSGIQQAEEEQ